MEVEKIAIIENMLVGGVKGEEVHQGRLSKVMFGMERRVSHTKGKRIF